MIPACSKRPDKSTLECLFYFFTEAFTSSLPLDMKAFSAHCNCVEAYKAIRKPEFYALEEMIPECSKRPDKSTPECLFYFFTQAFTFHLEPTIGDTKAFSAHCNCVEVPNIVKIGTKSPSIWTISSICGKKLIYF